MQNFFGWVTRFVAIFLMGVVSILLLSATSAVSNATVFIALLAGIASQIGLFVSPSAINWRSGIKKIVFISMLPSVFWLVRQTYIDGINVYRISSSGSSDELLEHSLELVFAASLLVLYLFQSIRLSAEFFRRPMVSHDDTSK